MNMLPPKRLICIMFVFLFVLHGSLNAEEEKPLTWVEVVFITSKIHPEIIAAEEKLKQAMADKSLAGVDRFPQVTAQESSSTSKVEGNKSTKSHSISLSASQLVFDGKKTGSDVKAAIESLKAAQYNLDVVSSDVRRNLRLAFVRLLRAQELIGLTQEISLRRRQNTELVELRYEAGREDKGAVLSSQADLASAEYEVSQAKREIELAQTELNRQLGEGKYKPIKVTGEFKLDYSYADKPDMLRLAEENPFLKELIAKKEFARWNIDSAKADYFPQVYLDGSAGRDDSEFLPRTDDWTAGIRVSLPLFEGGRRKASVEKSQAAFRQTEAELQSGKDSVIYTLEDKWAGLKDGLENVEVQKKFLEAAKERSKIAEAQYSNGLITFNDWTLIEDGLVLAKKSFLNAQAVLLTSEADWIQAKGGRLGYED